MVELDVFSLLGKPATDPAIVALLAACEVKNAPALAKGGVECRMAIKPHGIDLNFVPAQILDPASTDRSLVLSNVLFFGGEHAKYGYVAHDRPLPLGLRFAMTSPDVVALLGAPVQTWENDGTIKSQRWEHQGRRISVQYSKESKEIKSIEISIPKPGAP